MQMVGGQIYLPVTHSWSAPQSASILSFVNSLLLNFSSGGSEELKIFRAISGLCAAFGEVRYLLSFRQIYDLQEIEKKTQERKHSHCHCHLTFQVGSAMGQDNITELTKFHAGYRLEINHIIIFCPMKQWTGEQSIAIKGQLAFIKILQWVKT